MIYNCPVRQVPRAVLWLALLVTGGCARSSLPVLSPAAFAFDIDTLRTQRVRDGVNHHYIYSRTGPWAIHVLDARLSSCLTPIAVKGGAVATGRTKTSVLMQNLSQTRDVVGGVNADFFSLATGAPQGLHVSEGTVLTPANGRPAFAVDSAGVPVIALAPPHPREAVGGRPIIVRDSSVVSLADTAAFTTGRHPRTAVGIGSSGKRLLLAVVDGRQKPYSDGMNLRELASLMLALGARDALNLDGGGSTTLVYADPDSSGKLRIANHPSDKEGERAVGNALALVDRCAR
jgi:exopolysaccharide biosynthesis protein